MMSYSVSRNIIVIFLIVLLLNVPKEQRFADAQERSVSRPFRLRMYWERGYMWQEDPRPREFCIQCVNKCGKEDVLYTRQCTRGRYTQYFVKVGNSLRPLTNKGMCVTRTGRRKIALRSCDDALDEQQWYGFRFDGGKFELRNQVTNESKCLSQHHHPKPREVLYLEWCDLARQFDTSYWITE